MLTVDDLARFLQQDLTDYEAEAQDAVDQAVSTVEEHCKRRFAQVVDDERTMRWRARIILPDPPVGEISSVTVDGQAASYDIDLSGNLWLGRSGKQVTIVYTHGYETIPAAVRLVAVRLASRIFKNPMGRVSYSADGQSNSSAVDVSPRILTGDEMATLRKFKLHQGQ